MRTHLAKTTSLLALVPCLAVASQLHGVATDLAGNPLQGVVVERVSTGERTTSGSDGSWQLVGTAGVERSLVTAKSRTGTLATGKNGLALRFEGFRPDGKRERTQVRSEALPPVAASRGRSALLDTLAMDWMGAVFKRPIDESAPSMDMGVTSLDTNGLGRFLLVATRYRRMGMTMLRIDLCSLQPDSNDSLIFRFHMEGTRDEMADFAMRLDMGLHYDGAGFVRPAGLDPLKISKVRPKVVDGSCSADGGCDWTFDLPLEPDFELRAQSRLELHLALDRHLLTGDSTSLLNSQPTHDPFAGADWSFRSHRFGSMSGYPGVPVVDPELEIDPLVVQPVDPYIQLIGSGRILFGQAPRREE